MGASGIRGLYISGRSHTFEPVIFREAKVGRPKLIADAAVLAVARQVFREEGHAASTRQIAEIAGLSQATLFQRFGDKQRLFVAAMLPDALDADTIVGAPPPATDRNGIAHLCAIAQRLHAHIAEALPPLLQLAANPLSDPAVMHAAHTQLGVAPVIKAVEARIAVLQRRRQLTTRLPPEALTETLLLGMHGLVLQARVAPDSSSSAAAIERLVHVTCGVSPPAPSTPTTREKSHSTRR